MGVRFIIDGREVECTCVECNGLECTQGWCISDTRNLLLAGTGM
jgi:hypothetical protein